MKHTVTKVPGVYPPEGGVGVKVKDVVPTHWALDFIDNKTRIKIVKVFIYFIFPILFIIIPNFYQ